MKTEPTDIDREAAGLFNAAPGMRVVYVSSVNGRRKLEWCRVRDGANGVYGAPHALDTDDPATVGCMLAQVEASAPGLAVSVADRWHNLPGDSDRRFLVLVDHAEGHQTTATGPTRGATLVAAMRKLKGA